MARVAAHGKSLHSAWVVKKKGNGEWIVVAIGAVLGYGVILALLTFLQMSAAK
jgi:allophanate hydrolase subunit 1